ncbi:PREDICTED: uncharacterized protein LOC108563029 [Nicrophorus vespilloides]|uniref:Uncharacterized protein LOC108563029 n=1 Tax=Nicrophorus vespilloides TaxID=110193 RepID=A0ABM1MR61_NICVS|nr:PREDICTED: uncharacterized protein LOC108563029 [Nicrophorus vespilloides]
MEELFEKYCNLMKQSTKGTQIGVYSIAFISLGIALRRVRPFSKFKTAKQVPKLFINNGRELTGFVERIEPAGPLLMIQHKPLIQLPGMNKVALPVKVYGVNITGHGVSWLQSIVANNEVTFIPIEKNEKCVSCEIVFSQLNEKKQMKYVNVGESLVSIGFGTVQPFEAGSNITKMVYLARLRSAEKVALKRQMGFNYYVKPTKEILIKLSKRLNELIRETAKKQLDKLNVPKIALT